MPRRLWQLFSQSPFGPMQAHMAKAVETAHAVRGVIEGAISGDQSNVVTAAKQVSVLEGEADEAKNAIRDRLPQSLLMPVARGDLLRQLTAQDRIADVAEDVAVLFTLRPMECPEWMQQPLRDYLDSVLAVVDVSGEIIGVLDVLVETSFGGPEAERIMELISRVGRLEHEADKRQDQLSKALFQHEDELKPTAVFMWSKILGKIGDVADAAETCANRIRLLLARS